MSEFFKALEQAERDRQQAERSEQDATVAETADPDTADDVQRSARTPVVAAPPVAAPAPAAPVVTPPSPPRPGDGVRRSVFDRPPVRPEEPAVERAAPAAVQRPAAPIVERPGSRVAEGAAPRPVERDAAGRGRPRPLPVTGEATPSVTADPVPRERVASRPQRPADGPVLIADVDPRSVAAEAYRTLRANLEFLPSDSGCRHIVITSPSMGEGKSTTAANLAVVAAQAGSRVCLVDADMRRPTLHRIFGVTNHGGLTRALSQAMPLASVAIPTDVANLSLVVAGSSDGLRPAQLLNAPRLQKVLHDPSTPFDLVLFDTPPIISVADAMNLASHCDGVVLVVRAGAVPPSVLQQAVRQVDQVKGRVVGVVLNRVDLRRDEAEFYRYYRAYYTSGKKD